MRLPRYVFQIAAGLLVLGALLHVTTLWPKVAALSALLPTGVWLFFIGFAICVFTALLACALAGFLLWKAPDRADARALTLFLAFLAIYWGSLFRAGTELSMFGAQVDKYAWLYTTRASNLGRYSPGHLFRAPRARLAHE